MANYLKILFEILDTPDEINPDEDREYLIQRGYDPDKMYEDYLKFLEQKKAELLIEEGKKFKEKMDKLVNSEVDDILNDDEFRLAARNFSEVNDEDKKIFEQKLKKLKSMKDINNNNK